uniref:Uncharacterized protein n=1 Tax=Anguilla anguilla TaxID=7936 RepID=A0A0E9UA97_ANGAN
MHFIPFLHKLSFGELIQVIAVIAKLFCEEKTFLAFTCKF